MSGGRNVCKGNRFVTRYICLEGEMFVKARLNIDTKKRNDKAKIQYSKTLFCGSQLN